MTTPTPKEGAGCGAADFLWPGKECFFDRGDKDPVGTFGNTYRLLSRLTMPNHVLYCLAFSHFHAVS